MIFSEKDPGSMAAAIAAADDIIVFKKKASKDRPEFDQEKYKKNAIKAIKDLVKKIKSHPVWKESAIYRDPIAKGALERVVKAQVEDLNLEMKLVLIDVD